MAIFRKKITEARKEYLEEVIGNLVFELKEREDVECISYICFKEDRLNMPASPTGNTFELKVILNCAINQNIEEEFEKYERKFCNDNFFKKSGVEFIISLSNNKNYRILDAKRMNFTNRELLFGDYRVRYVRHLYLSNIIYDKDGYYSKVAHQFDDYYDMNKERINEIIDLGLNIDLESLKVKTFIR